MHTTVIGKAQHWLFWELVKLSGLPSQIQRDARTQLKLKRHNISIKIRKTRKNMMIILYILC